MKVTDHTFTMPEAPRFGWEDPFFEPADPAAPLPRNASRASVKALPSPLGWVPGIMQKEIRNG